MSFSQKVRLFFQILLSYLVEGLSKWRGSEKIALTDRLYLRVPDPKPKLTLISGAGGEGIMSIQLSADEARKIFRSIKHACDFHEVVEINMGDWSWKTDATSSQNVVVVLKRSLAYSKEIAKREDIIAAIADFTDRFGLE